MEQEGAGNATEGPGSKCDQPHQPGVERGRSTSEGKLKELRAALVCIGGRCVAGQMCEGELKVCRDFEGLWAS